MHSAIVLLPHKNCSHGCGKTYDCVRGRRPLAIYVHWPYCVSKCPYCDFNSHVATMIDHNAFRAAYARELTYYANLLPQRRITSIFFGGGTPSLMEPETVAQIIGDIGRLWTLDDNIEITLEANPSSVEVEKFTAFRSAGVNRLSLGVQSLREDDLKFLGRAHDTATARHAIELAATTFPRFSFDLIYARKNQTLAAWREELSMALTLAGDHLSLYQLTIEPATQFYTLTQRGEILTAPEDEAAAMYEATQDIMAQAGLPAYEISNHARHGYESRHNLTYWYYRDYLGIGPGAHGRYALNDKKIASDNHRAPDVWLKYVRENGHGAKASDSVDHTTMQREALMMGLRLTQGIATAEWQEKFRAPLFTDANNTFLAPQKIKRLREEGYIAEDSEHLRATPSGLQRLNAILNYLLN